MKLGCTKHPGHDSSLETTSSLSGTFGNSRCRMSSRQSSISTYILETLEHTGNTLRPNRPNAPLVRKESGNPLSLPFSSSMPRAGSNAGLAAQTGWIGSVARFWEVSIRTMGDIERDTADSQKENLCPRLHWLRLAVSCIYAGNTQFSGV